MRQKLRGYQEIESGVFASDHFELRCVPYYHRDTTTGYLQRPVLHMYITYSFKSPCEENLIARIQNTARRVKPIKSDLRFRNNPQMWGVVEKTVGFSLIVNLLNFSKY